LCQLKTAYNVSILALSYSNNNIFAFANLLNYIILFFIIKKIFVFLGSEAVLGPQTNNSSLSAEQRVGRQKLRPGSGFLSIRVTTDGPTRVLQILDIKERVCITFTYLSAFTQILN